MPRAASASAFLRMAAITGAESTGKLRGAAKEMYAERCAASWNDVSAHAAAGRATMPCRGALADLHQPRPSSLVARAHATRDGAHTRSASRRRDERARYGVRAFWVPRLSRGPRLLCCKNVKVNGDRDVPL